MSAKPIKPPGASRQIAFHQLLVAARKSWLVGALTEALSTADPRVVKKQLSAYIPSDVQKILASTGVRDEHVFPVPIVLETKPTLIGYYRLLLGIPQKSFYKTDTGMAQFKSMETRGLLKQGKRPDLEGFCAAMAQSLADLVRQISPRFSPRDVTELPLLRSALNSKAATTTPLANAPRLTCFLRSRNLSRLTSSPGKSGQSSFGTPQAERS